MKYTVGLSYENGEFIDCILKNKEHISEVYFSWGDFASGRGNQSKYAGYTSYELWDMQAKDLRRLSDGGMKFNLLFNANCYGKDSQSRVFFEKVGTTADYIKSTYGLSSITTASPLIAKFIKSNFEDIEVRASVNMEIGTIQGMSYLSEYFDSFYMQRELNRDFVAIEKLSKWCKENGKKLFMLANSGCLNHCSAHNFHNNLVAHESEISQMDNAYNFPGICKEYLRDEKNYMSLINDTNFVRPEDMYKYEPYFEAAKLATRVHKSPCMVVNSYINKKYSGNILDILEPAHSIYPYVVENGEPLKLVKLDNI